MPLKKGSMSDADRRFIQEHVDDMTLEEIAEKLERSPKIIDKEIKNLVNLPQAKNKSIRWHLHGMPEWRSLKQQFESDELNLIEDKYVKYVESMQGDLFAMEESQLLNMIKLEILMDRNLRAHRSIMYAIKNYEKERNIILKAVGENWSELDEDSRKRVQEIENHINGARNAESYRASQYLDIQKELNSLNTKMKASRDQRIGKVLDPKASFTEYVKSLLDRDKQEKESRFIQLHTKAASKEKHRLSQAHQYADGSYDNPLLSAEILEDLEKQDKETDNRRQDNEQSEYD